MSQLFNNTLETIKRNKKKREEGGFNCIPFPFPRLNTYLPGILKGTQYLITASSGIGKTQLAKYMFVYSAYNFIKNNPELGLKLNILYFALEESKEEFMLSMISNRLKEKYGLRISITELQSYHSLPITDMIVEKIEECEEYFRDLEDTLEIIDNVSNPTGIYKKVREHSDKHGTHHKKTIMIDGIPTEVYSHYEPYDDDTYNIVILDHMSLLQPEKGAKLHESMTMMSAQYARKQITKHWKYVFVGVQQQTADKEKMQYTYKGDSIEAKMKPSLDGLGDNKLTQRDAHVVLGLFAPDRYDIRTHLGFRIDLFRDHFRSLLVLKNRIGRSNLELPLFFDGETNVFKELPRQVNDLDVPTLIKKYKQ